MRGPRSTSTGLRRSCFSTARWQSTGAASSSGTSRISTARRSSPTASGRRRSTSATASSSPITRGSRPRRRATTIGGGDACLPRLTARLIHFHGADNLVRLFRGDRAIPATWQQLHALFVRACDQRFERSIAAAAGRGSARDPGHRRAGIRARAPDRAARHRKPDARRTRLGEQQAPRVEQAPPTRHRSRRRPAAFTSTSRAPQDWHASTARPKGAKIGYLDTTPLALAIEHDDRGAARARRRMTGPAPISSSSSGSRFSRRSARRSRPAAMPTCAAMHASPVDLPVDIRVGLSRITRELTAPNPRSARMAPSIHPQGPPRQTAPARGASRFFIRRPPMPRRSSCCRLPATRGRPTPWCEPAAPAPPPATRDAQWRVNDRSAAGWRISAPGGVGQSLALGALVAMSSGDGDEWMLGVVSRLSKKPRDEVEAGMSLIASRVVPVTLYGRRQAQAEMSVVVDGIDISTRGARFDGLYLMPPTRLDTRLAMRTLIIPTSEYFEGRNVILSTRELELLGDAGCRHRSARRLDLGDDARRGKIGAPRLA